VIFGIGEGSRRWLLQSALGVSRRDKRRNFSELVKGVGVGFSSWRWASHGGTNVAIFGIGEGSWR